MVSQDHTITLQPELQSKTLSQKKKKTKEEKEKKKEIRQHGIGGYGQSNQARERKKEIKDKKRGSQTIPPSRRHDFIPRKPHSFSRKAP